MVIGAPIAVGRSSKCRFSLSICAYLVLAAWVAPATAYEAGRRFLFISSSSKSSIEYISLPNLREFVADGDSSDNSEDVEKTTLITGLSQPAGLAVWQGKDNAYLYVAVTGESKILAYELYSSLDQHSVSAGSPTTVASGLGNVYGLAVDGFGNLYYSTTDGTVGKLASEKGSLSSSAQKTTLYTSDDQTVSKPAALAADSFYVYWGNTESGATTGSVVKAFERDAEKLKTTYPDYPKALAKNSDKAMGVCIARANVFFTGESQSLFGVTSDGGTPVEISHGFQSPRGCAYDGDNTIYVADSDGGAIYSLPANFLALRAVNRLTKVAQMTSPEHVVVFTNSRAYVKAGGGFLSWFR